MPALGPRPSQRGRTKKSAWEKQVTQADFREFLADCEYEVKAALRGDSDDLALNNLVELALVSIREERPLFHGILEEPAFWRRHFHRWVKDWVEEEEALSAAHHNAMLDIMAIPNAY